MSNENNKFQIDIENLFKQNVNDLTAIKELYRRIEELGEKITQFKYIDNTLSKKLQKDYEKLTKIILDENIQAKLTTDIEAINSQMDTKTSKEETNTVIKTINSLEQKKADEADVKVLSERINNFTTLPEGSTTGDAELMDGRIGTDGITYNNLGEAIRTQIGGIDDIVAELDKKTEKFDIQETDIELTSDVYPYTTNVGADVTNVKSDGRYSYKINVVEGKTYEFFCNWYNSLYGLGYIFADENNKSLEYYYNENATAWEAGTLTKVAPTGAKYLYINRRSQTLTISEVRESTVRTFKAYTKDETYSKDEIDNKITDITSKKIKPTILFLFDNGGYDNRVDLLNKYGFKGTFNINNTSGTLNSSSSKFTEIKKLIKEGHDIGVYCGYGNGTTKPPFVGEGSENWYQFIKNATDVFQSLGIYYPSLYGCMGLKASKPLVEACEKLGFVYISCYIQYVNSENNSDSTNIWYNVSKNSPYSNCICPFSMYDSGVTFETIKTQIDNAIANNYILPLFTHDVNEVGDSQNVSLEIFTKVLQYVKTLADENKVDVLTYRQLFNKYNIEKGKELDYTRIMSSIVEKTV